ncbi:hypothetical protein [Pseudonocardia acidicola]|uniref:Cytochrome P450 n=1 Tax=Pseudonocardia acidicola TaxID=2724939 RepID=A0ABX1SB29_9PSEU|nr:hypothetical protein [Pseudonocardia acidicola]NMH98754.1 hypothetical protein [Pseudonocardia acidicola]
MTISLSSRIRAVPKLRSRSYFPEWLLERRRRAERGPRSAPYRGSGAPGPFEWMHPQLAEEHVVLMGATSYRLMSEIVANGDDPTFPRRAELPEIVFSKTLEPPLTWANTTTSTNRWKRP